MRESTIPRAAGVLLLALLFFASLFVTLAPADAASVDPILIEQSGNLTCPELASTYGFDGTNELKFDPPGNGTLTGLNGLAVTVSNFDGKSFDWSSNQGIDAVYVKAGQVGSYLYLYDPPESTGDTGLTSPGVTGNEISHITFCYDNTTTTTPPTTTPPTTIPPTTIPPTTIPPTTIPPTTTTPTTTTPTTTPELLGAIGDYVWFDVDVDGFQDSLEKPVPDVTVHLYDFDSDALLATTATDSDGKYLFDNLPAGNYFVEFVLSTVPAKYKVTGPDKAEDDVDSDGNEFTGRTTIIVLGAGVVDLTWDLGIWITEVLPQVITTSTTSTTVADTTAETLPFTGFGQGAIGGLGLVMVMMGGLALLTIRRRDNDLEAGTENTLIVTWEG